MIRCCRCKKKIDKLVKYENVQTKNVHFEMWCHGEMESFTIDESIFVTEESISITDYEAFKPALEASVPKITRKP